jgi:hypothetical protein
VGEGTVTEKNGYRYVTYDIECTISPVSLINVDMAYNFPDYGKGGMSLERLFEP